MKDLADCHVLLVDDARANLDIPVEGLSNHKLTLAFNGEIAASRRPPEALLEIAVRALSEHQP
jgi:hypothetical protein